MLLGLSEALPNLVEAKFSSARASSSLVYSATEVATIRTLSGIPVCIPIAAHRSNESLIPLQFQLRFCPSLAKKPTPKNDDAKQQKKTDPFEKPPESLHIASIPSSNPTHILVLNKFPIIAGHFILATKSNKKQTHVLEQDDLEATYACLKAWQMEQGSKQQRLFAFFNSGDHSGASQPHRHLQFLPVESMHHGEATSSWDLLMDIVLSGKNASSQGELSTPIRKQYERMKNHPRTIEPSADLADDESGLLQHPGLPFVHFARQFSSEPSGSDILSIYKELYDAAKSAVDNFIASRPGELTLHPDDSGDMPISYNLAMTTSGMTILPRRSEGTMLQNDSGKDVGFVALNGTTLGGTMMVSRPDTCMGKLETSTDTSTRIYRSSIRKNGTSCATVQSRSTKYSEPLGYQNLTHRHIISRTFKMLACTNKVLN